LLSLASTGQTSRFYFDYTPEGLDALSLLQEELDIIASRIVTHYAYDTIATAKDSLLAWIPALNSKTAKFWEATEYVLQKDNSKAIAVINSIAQEFTLTVEEQTDVDNFRALIELIGDRYIYDLDEIHIDLIIPYDQVGGNTQLLAENILTMYGHDYPPEYVLSLRSGVRAEEKDREPLNNNGRIIVYPNPANEFVIFDAINMDSPEINLVISDINGRKIMRTQIETNEKFIWDSSANSSGIYIYQISTASGVLASGKIIVTK